METQTIWHYAVVHGLDPATLTDLAAEVTESDLTPQSPLAVTVLDQMAASIDDTATEDLADALEGVEDARSALADAEGNLRRSVREALADGVRATRVAEVLGVSRARVYQIRDGKR